MFEDIIETAREPLVVLDANLRVLLASRSFYESFRVMPEETVGNLIYDLGNRQWDIPSLRTLLEEMLPKNNKFDDYKVEHVFSSIGHSQGRTRYSWNVPGPDRPAAQQVRRDAGVVRAKYPYLSC